MSGPEKPYTVVVGVSATSKSPTALVWGKALADANQGRLVAVRISPAPASDEAPGTPVRSAPSSHQTREEQRAALERDVAEVLGEENGAEIRVIHGSKRRGLINEARDADVLV